MSSALGLGHGLPHGGNQVGSGGSTPPAASDALLMESSDYILLEDGSKTLLE